MKYLFRIAKYLRKFILYRVLRLQTRGVRVILRDENKILLIKHPYDDFWVFPGGGIRRGESPMVAGAREVIEETGYSVIDDMKMLGEYVNKSGGKNDIVTVFVAKKITKAGVKQKLLDKIEIEKSQWFEMDSLPEISTASRRRINELSKVYQNNVDKLW